METYYRIANYVYSKDNLIAKGAFGTVYKISYAGLSPSSLWEIPEHESLVIKQLDKSKYKIKGKLFSYLTAEINTMLKIDHPNIIKLYDCVSTWTHFNLITKFYNGGEL